MEGVKGGNQGDKEKNEGMIRGKERYGERKR